MRKFYDMECDRILTEEQLRGGYEEFKHDIELSSGATTFEQHLNNCLSKNGTLQEIGVDCDVCEWCGDVYDIDQLKREINLGLLCDRCIGAIWSRGEKLYLEV